MNKEDEKAYKIFLLLENRLEQDLKKSKKYHEFKIYNYTKNLLDEIRRNYKGLI